MQTFATDFPVDSSHGPEDFLNVIRIWLLQSPHSSLSEPDLEGMLREEEWSVKKQSELVESLLSVSAADESAAVRYRKVDANLQWVTSVVFSKHSTDAWVGIRIFCESSLPSANLPAPKKPVLVRTLLERLGGGYDGDIRASDVPISLGNCDIEFAARCVSGGSGCRLPVVYVSAPFKQACTLNAERLARDLSGMAHVLVEPNRAFASRLMIEVNAQNVYGGAVGIYWPDGGGRRVFIHGRDFKSSAEGEASVKEEIRNALSNRRLLSRCTWMEVQENVSRLRHKRLLEKGSSDVNEFITNFDQEIAAKNSKLEEAEREILRLEAEVRRLQAANPVQSGFTLQTGAERDLYPGEIGVIIHDALADAVDRVQTGSRRQHVLTNIVEANPPGPENASMKAAIKALLRDYKRMDARCRSELQEMGFQVTEGSKHHKIIFQGDDRYTFTLPTSGSDWCGGRNSASDIIRLLL